MITPPNCNDCGAERGRAHHLNCDMAFCAICGNQIIARACDHNERDDLRLAETEFGTFCACTNATYGDRTTPTTVGCTRQTKRELSP